MKSHKWVGAGLLAAISGIVFASTAWACVSGPSVFTSTVNAKAGDEVGVKGTYFFKDDPVMVHFNALDGPVLADLGAPTGPQHEVAGKITVPPGTKPGNYVLVFTQTGADGKFTQSPSRALLSVVGDGGAQPAVGAPLNLSADQREPHLVRGDTSVSGASMALVAVGIGGIAMFMAGAAALLAGRRASGPEAVRVQS